MLHIAFYTGDHKADAGWRARFGVAIIRLAQRGAKFADATHCEIILGRSETGESIIGSATMIPENKVTGRNGVRIKSVTLAAEHWRVYLIPYSDRKRALAFFQKEDGKPYDLFGAIASAVNIFIAKADSWFCSKICAEALGLVDGGQFTPAELEAVCASVGTDVTEFYFKEVGHD